MANISGSPFLVKWIGQGPSANGQIIADITTGPKAKSLLGLVTITEDGANTAFTVGFIDGTQKIAQYSVVLPLQSAAAPVTLNGVANQALYSGVSGAGNPNSIQQLVVGQSVTIAGFSNAGNNGTFTIKQVITNGFYVTNASSVAETNYSANVTYVSGAAVAAAELSEGNLSSDTSTTTLTAAGALSSVTNAGMSGALSGAGTNGHIKTAVVKVYLAS